MHQTKKLFENAIQRVELLFADSDSLSGVFIFGQANIEGIPLEIGMIDSHGEVGLGMMRENAEMPVHSPR